MREVLSVHVGQAGCQIGDACWELFCLEHGIDDAGRLSTDASASADRGASSASCAPAAAFFAETESGVHVPRALFCDLDPHVTAQLRRGVNGRRLHPGYMHTGREEAVSYARGYYTVGRAARDACADTLRRMVEACDAAQGFMLYHAAGGGTGSGVSSLLLEHMCEVYPKLARVSMTLMPSPYMSTSTVETYNAALSMDALLERADLTVLYDNEALYSVCAHKLQIESPAYANVNAVIAQSAAAITASMRLGGYLNANFEELIGNLRPFPRVHFVVPSLGGLVSSEKTVCTPQHVGDITTELFDPASALTRVNMRKGKYMACTVSYRGDIVPRDICASIASIKTQRTIQFVDWCPTGFKVGIDYAQPRVIPGGDMSLVSRMGSMLSNTSAVKGVFERLARRHSMMYAKRAMVWWYVTEGHEEGSFTEAAEELHALVADYDEVEASELGAENADGDDPENEEY